MSVTMMWVSFAVLFWGISAFLDKMTLKYVGPETAYLGRLLVMVVLFIPVLIGKGAQGKTFTYGLNKMGLVYVAASVIITMSGVFCYTKALAGGEASKIVPISSVYPMITFVLAMLFLGEQFSWQKFSGTMLAMAGVWLLTR